MKDFSFILACSGEAKMKYICDSCFMPEGKSGKVRTCGEVQT